MRKCSKCKKLLSTVFFYKDRTKKSGLKYQCKKCQYHPEQKRIYRLKNIDKVRRWHRNNWLKNKGKLKEKRYIKKYGLTIAELKNMYEKNGNKCLLCERKVPFKKIVVDHDHRTGRFRGLICTPCNFRVIGIIESYDIGTDKYLGNLRNYLIKERGQFN